MWKKFNSSKNLCVGCSKLSSTGVKSESCSKHDGSINIIYHKKLQKQQHKLKQKQKNHTQKSNKIKSMLTSAPAGWWHCWSRPGTEELRRRAPPWPLKIHSIIIYHQNKQAITTTKTKREQAPPWPLRIQKSTTTTTTTTTTTKGERHHGH